MASMCLEHALATVFFWSLASPTANFTTDAHGKGVNYVDFYPGSDKPYLVTTAIKIWDYLSKSCVPTMEGRTNNPSFAVSHPNLSIYLPSQEHPQLCTGARLVRRDVNEVAVGFDEGIVVIKLEPTYGMDASGKLQPHPLVDPGDRYHRNLCDGAAALAEWTLRDCCRAFGSGTGFAWVGDSNTYAVLESKVKLRVFKNLEERGDAGMKGTGSWAVDAIYGGPVLGARGMGFVIFWGWESGEIGHSWRAFDVVAEIPGRRVVVKTIGDCFIYTKAGNRLNYYLLSLSVVERLCSAVICDSWRVEDSTNLSVDLKERALQVTTDPDHQFDLSPQLDDLDTVDLAQESFEKKLAATAEKKGANNLAFATLFQLGDAKPCVDLLVQTNRAPEAALFARTYAPSEVPKVVAVRRDELRTKNKGKIAGSGGTVDVNEDSDISPNESDDLYVILFSYVLETANHKVVPANREELPNSQIVIFVTDSCSMSFTGATPLISAYGRKEFDEFCINFADEVMQSYMLRNMFQDRIGYSSHAVGDGVPLPSISTMDNSTCNELLRGEHASERSTRKARGVLGVLSKSCSSFKSGKAGQKKDEDMLQDLISKCGSHASFVASPSQIGAGEGNLFGINHSPETAYSAFVTLLRKPSDASMSKLVSGRSLAAERHFKDEATIVQAQVSSCPLRSPTPMAFPDGSVPPASEERARLNTFEIYPVTTQANHTLSEIIASLDHTHLRTISCFDVMRLRASAFTQEVFTIDLGKAVTIMVNPDMAVHPSSAPSARYMLIFKKKTSKWCSVLCCNTFSITIALCNARYFVGNVSV
ncbi:hypothetical protein EDD22DRAFT_1021100 [Suillus occidentalis]|nr:hypothetical protein EDD22DRAFT_1021100 [Suillus occidentalis]